MIKLLLAGPREFTDRIERQNNDYSQIRIINLATEPSQAVEALENSAKGADAVLLGFSDDEIKLMIDVATRHEVQSVIFVSVDDMATAYRKWAQYKLKLAREGFELETINKYFAERPELIKHSAVRNNKDKTLFEDLDENEDDSTGSNARIDEVRRRELSNRGVPVDKKVITVFGQKGGNPGKTVLTVSMAQSIATVTNLKVVVLDLDINRAYGDVIRYFGYLADAKEKIITSIKKDDHYNGPRPREKTLSAWSDFPWQMRGNRDVVLTYLIEIRKNLYILPPIRGMTDNKLTYDLVQKTIDVLRRHFAVILIDGGNTLSDPTLSAMENSDELLIVFSPELPVLDNLVDFTTDTIRYINGDPNISLVANKVPPGKDPFKLNESIPEATGGFPVRHQLPRDTEVYEMLSRRSRVPYLGAHDTPFTREMEKFLLHFFPRELFPQSTQSEKKGFFRKLFTNLFTFKKGGN